MAVAPSKSTNIPWKAIGKINLLNVGQEDVHGIQTAGVNAQGHSQSHGGESGNENGGGTHYDCLVVFGLVGLG